MSTEEYAEILRGLKANLELMEASGIKNLARMRPVLEEVNRAAANCNRCALNKTGGAVVVGTGNPEAALFFIHGTPFTPGGDGTPYSGPEGELLEKIIRSMGFTPEDVYLSFAVKCAAAADAEGGGGDEHSVPGPALSACSSILSTELEAIRPRIMVLLGPTATLAILGTTDVSAMRGRLLEIGRTKAVCTYSPAQMLADPGLKKAVWADMQLCIKALKSQ